MNIRLSILIYASAASLSLGACEPADAVQGESRELSCEVLTAGNCWKDALAEIAACAPMEAGELDREAQMCHYDDGTIVDLTATPWEPGFPSDGDFDFEMTNSDGELCARLHHLGQFSFELTTASGTIVWDYDDVTSLSCPDGTTYTTSGLELARCDDGLSHWPGVLNSFGEEAISVSLQGGAGIDGSATRAGVFRCWDDAWEQ